LAWCPFWPAKVSHARLPNEKVESLADIRAYRGNHMDSFPFGRISYDVLEVEGTFIDILRIPISTRKSADNMLVWISGGVAFLFPRSPTSKFRRDQSDRNDDDSRTAIYLTVK
jgi:hypothetical protein